MNQPSAQHTVSLLATALQAQMPLLRKAAAFSVLSSLLLLTPTLFMLEVYDRVINSRSTTTLLMLLLCTLGLYVLMEVLELVRSKFLQLAGWQLDAALREKLHDALFAASLRQGASSTQPFTDLKTLRDLSSRREHCSLVQIFSRRWRCTRSRHVRSMQGHWHPVRCAPAVC